jgi:kumamolisin
MGLGMPMVKGMDMGARSPSPAVARCMRAGIFALLLALAPKLGAVAVSGDIGAPGPDSVGASRTMLRNSIKEVPTGTQPAVAGQPTTTGPRVSRTELTAQEANAPMPFNVSLKMRNFAELQARVARGEVIDPAEMAQKYWPLPQDYADTVNWLRQQGFTISPDSGGFMIFASGTVAQVSNAFQVSLARVTNDGAEFTSAITAPSVPAELAPKLIGVNGLQPHLRKHPHIAHPASTGTPFASPYTPSDIKTAYGANTLTQTGAGQTIAIVMESYPLTTDLTKFWTECNITQSVGNVTFVDVNGGPSGEIAQDEASLDVEWSSGIAPAAKIRLYGTPSLADSDLQTAYQQIYNDASANTQFGLHVVSLSYGGNEETSSILDTDDQLFTQLVSLGITVFASSGDNGSAFASSPATDPEVTAVGGTSIAMYTNSTTNNTLNLTGTVKSETVWNSGSGASGGGVSGYFPKPYWQTGTGVLGSNGNRMVPDLSAPADPNTGAFYVLNGANSVVGGTSWSAPTWAGFATLINQARLSRNESTLGLLNPKIYPLLLSGSFADITSGNNSTGGTSSLFYSAGTGYDMCTGIGRPVFPALLQQLTTVLLPPQNVTVNTGANAVFSPITNGATSFQWQRMAANTATWANVTDNSTYNGNATAVLTVNSTTAAMSGDQFQCLINGNIATPAATLIVEAPQYVISTFAGQAGVNGAADGLGTNAQFNLPNEVAVDSGGNIWVADTNNNEIRKITAAGNVTTFAGNGTAGYVNANGNSALFDAVSAVGIGSGGNLFVTDELNNAIRKITAAGNVTTFAGSNTGTSGYINGTATNARFDAPQGVVTDSGGNLYVTDTNNNAVRKITTTGSVSTFAGSTNNSTIGTGTPGSINGNGTAARFNFPSAIAIDAGGNIYVADSNNNAIRKITPAGNVTTLAGSPPFQGTADGTGSFARFNFPSGVAVDSGGNVFVADSFNNSIRKITPAGVVTTVAGQPGVTGSADGVGSEAKFNTNYGVAVDATGNLYIADSLNNTIRKAQLSVAIQSQPANTTVSAGNPANFSVTATGAPVLAYQWQLQPGGGGPWVDLTDDGTYTGTATANLTINSTTDAMDGDVFRVMVSNGLGSVTSNTAVLTISDAPTFTLQPVNQITSPGGGASFTVAATGSPNTISYQWQMLAPGSSTWANLTDDGVTFSGSATATLSVSNATLAQSGTEFQCVASNGVNPNATSNIALLSVDIAPSISAQPADETVTAGGAVVFSFTAGGIPAPAIQWQRLPSGGSIWANLTNSATYAGATTNNLTINATTTGMNGDQFRAIISNPLANLTSNVVTLTVQSPPAITAQPANVSVVLGNSTSFTVASVGNPEPTYQWQRLPAGSSVWANLTDNATYSGSATATLTINATTADMNGDQFQCLLINTVGNVMSTPATLSIVVAPVFTTQPQNTAVIVGGTATLTAVAAGLPGNNITYLWEVAPSFEPHTWIHLSDFPFSTLGNYSGETTDTLVINNATAALTGYLFRCLAGNGVTNDTISAQAQLAVGLPLSIITPPANAYVLSGNYAPFSINVQGLYPITMLVQTSLDNGNTWSMLYQVSTSSLFSSNFSVVTEPFGISFNLEASPATNGELVRFVENNPFGELTSTVTLNILVPPAITTQPINETVSVGTAASFSVAATSLSGNINYQWQMLAAGSSAWANLTDDGVTFAGSATATLTISNVTLAQSGAEFQCIVSNGALPNPASSAATLTVVPAGYLSWAAALNLAGASALPTATPFNDTIPNLVRFAMNAGAPPAPGALPGLSTQVINNVPYLTLQYNVSNSLTGITLVAQYSYDLVTWTTLANGAVVQVAGGTAQTTPYQASVAIPANGTIFLRLVVAPTP